MNELDILTSSSSSDSDCSLENVRYRTERNFQERTDETYYSDDEFKRRFRFSKQNIAYLEKLVEKQLSNSDNRGFPLTVKQKIMICLRYYATGCFQVVSGDLMGVTQSTACITIHEVSRAFAGLSRQFIKMPTKDDERTKSQQEFYNLNKIPRCIGCIDGCHIPIKSPGGDNAEIYRNRKRYFSINVQAVCDANCKFINLVARWHGSAHDQTIYNFSKLKRRLEIGEFGNSLLSSDGGYGCNQYLITPYRNPHTRQQIAYNKALCSTRACIKRTFGMWKRRFSVLGKASQIHIDNLLTVIVATAVLHNIAVDLGDEIDDNEQEVIPVDEGVRSIPPNLSEYVLNTDVRRLITQTF